MFPKNLTITNMGLNRFFQILVPKDNTFYPHFKKAANNLVNTSVLLCDLMKASSWDEREKIKDQIKELERTGDNMTHEMFDLLNQSFITPFDREDIHALISSIDDVVDCINGSAQKILMYKPKDISGEFMKLADLINQGSVSLKYAVDHIEEIKKPVKIKEACIKINEIENIADDICHQGVSHLFNNEKDTIELIKKKEILIVLEKATDKLEDASDVLKSILIKQA